MSVELLRLHVEDEDDVFVVRQRARVVAAELGADEHDQVRVATALSEIGREALRGDGVGLVTLAVDLDTDPLLRVVVSARHGTPWPSPDGVLSSEGFLAARRLMDGVELEELGDHTWTARLHKALPRGDVPTRHELAALRERLRMLVVSTPLDELRRQNEELVTTLEQLRSNQEELMRLNAELVDTNRGVLAMYTQLSDELEETNRGVVALYAELDEKQLALRDASEAKSRFLASVSHELRSPVSSVLALARLMLEPDADALSVEQRRQVTLMATAAGELLDLVNQLLDLAKAESGRLQPHPGPVSLADLFSELRGALRPLARPDLALDLEEPSVSLVVETDRTMLTQVLRNLLTNAIKFTEEGSVRMWAREHESGEDVEIVVRDTGIGIAPEDQARVFEEFFQVRSDVQARQPGTGLGLPYSRRVVDVLGGSLTLESEPGVGTTVAVCLPIRWMGSQTVVGRAAPDSAGPPAVRVDRALVVDDDPAFRHVLKGMLQGIADEVVEAGDAASGLDLALGSNPDIVFLDLRMPDMHGSELLGRLAGDARARDIPVVVVTSVDLEAPEVARVAGTATLAKSTLTRDQVAALVAESVQGVQP